MNHYPFHIGDYASATRHLSWDEDMAYRRLIDAYYTREAPIPLDRRQACRLVLATTQEQREAVDAVLAEFFIETPDGWRHSRCEAEIAIFKDKSAKAAKSAKTRWGALQAAKGDGAMPPQSEGNANASDDDANASGNGCEGNATKTKTKTKTMNNPQTPAPAEAGSDGVGDPFAQFWMAYPKKAAKEAARKAFDKLDPATLPLILDALSWQTVSKDWTKNAGQFIPNPATYLNGHRWLDERPAQTVAGLTPAGSASANAADAWLKSQNDDPMERKTA